MSALLFVTYPSAPGARFVRDYYVAAHLPLVEKAWGPFGLSSAEAMFPAGDASVAAVAVLTFVDEAAIAASLGSAATPEVLGDLPNFTDIQPQILRGTPL